MILSRNIYTVVTLAAFVGIGAAAANAQTVASFKDVSITADDACRCRTAKAQRTSRRSPASTMQSLRPRHCSRLVTCSQTTHRLSPLTQAEQPVFNLVRDRRYLEAVLEIVERREREAAKASPALLETRAKEIYDAAPTGFKVPPKVKVAHVLIRLGERSLKDASFLLNRSLHWHEAVTRGKRLWTPTATTTSQKLEGVVGDFYDNNSTT